MGRPRALPENARKNPHGHGQRPRRGGARVDRRLPSNIVVDRDYAILGVIDWEGACTVPWELVAFPHFLETVPRAMDAAWNYDAAGVPVDADTRRLWRERAEYADMVVRCEGVQGRDDGLSVALRDAAGQALAYAVEVFHEPGKLGFYDRLLAPFERGEGQ